MNDSNINGTENTNQDSFIQNSSVVNPRSSTPIQTIPNFIFPMQEVSNIPQSEERTDMNQTLPVSQHQLASALTPMRLENLSSLNQSNGIPSNPIANRMSIIKQELDIKPTINQADIIAIKKFPIKEPTPLHLEYFSCPLNLVDEDNPCPKYDSEWKVRQHIEYFHKISVGCQKMLKGISIRKQML